MIGSTVFFNGKDEGSSELSVPTVGNSILSILSCRYLPNIHVVIVLHIGNSSAGEMCGPEMKIENQQYTILFKT